MWTHYCREEQEELEVGNGEECNWCGLDGFDEAIIGIGEQYGKSPLHVYSYSVICKILRERDGMSWEEADEYAQFNIANVWVGERTPLILYNEYWEDWK
jgi:hypothetical protein